MPTLYDTHEIQGGQEDKPRKVALVDTPQLMVGANVLLSGQSAKLHTHAHEEKFYLVLSGEGVVQVGDEEHRVRAGHLVHCPIGVPHGATNDGTEDLRLLVVMGPHPKR